jgi:hypothetical protein
MESAPPLALANEEDSTAGDAPERASRSLMTW